MLNYPELNDRFIAGARRFSRVAGAFAMLVYVFRYFTDRFHI